MAFGEICLVSPMAFATVRNGFARAELLRKWPVSEGKRSSLRSISRVTSCLSMLLIEFFSARPTMPIGMEPRRTASANRQSAVCRACVLPSPRKNERSRARMSRPKYRTAARIAPTWMTAVKPISPSRPCRSS